VLLCRLSSFLTRMYYHCKVAQCLSSVLFDEQIRMGSLIGDSNLGGVVRSEIHSAVALRRNYGCTVVCVKVDELE